MTIHDLLVYTLGLVAQLLFSARILLQWLQSEKAGQVLSPASFWITSLLASLLLMAYGLLRLDPVIIGGQVISYYIYLRNLHFKGLWLEVPSPGRWLLLVFPLAALLVLTQGWLPGLDARYSMASLLDHHRISGTLLAWGGIGQVIFTLRFVYQWYYSEKRQESVIPAGFWLLSLVGSGMIVSYAVLRRDPVLFIGQVFGLLAYSRNLALGLRARPSTSETI